MQIEKIYKRNHAEMPYKVEKITEAVLKAMISVQNGGPKDAENIAKQVNMVLVKRKMEIPNYVPNVEEIQDLVEQTLMKSEFLDTAKSYILYRNIQSKKRQRNIFQKRITLKPFEYPELYEYVPAIRHSYWIHTEFNFTSDIQDFKTRLSDVERSAIKNAMLAISQIEVAVKNFWGDVYHKIPKPEVGAVGATFAESEVRHTDAYSHLLEILGLNEEFKNLKKNPVIMKRVRYLDSALVSSKSENDKQYMESVLLFSLFIEHVSLFSQFLIIMAFNKHKNMLKGISNVVEATSKEEQIHGDFGIDLIKIVKKENPQWFDVKYDFKIQNMCKAAYEAESAIIDWIFEKGEVEFLPKNQVKEFIKDRFNRSLDSIGVNKIFETNQAVLNETEWFNDEIIGTKHVDFFVKRSINYSKKTQSITAHDLF